MFGMVLRQTMELRQTQTLPKWSLVDAFKEGGFTSPVFPLKTLDCSAMSLEDRLKAVDLNNEVFHYSYDEEKTSQGTTYFKRALHRTNPGKKVRISKKEYITAQKILSYSGRFQRIARAVRYHKLYSDIKEFVQGQGCSLDDVVVVGIDRGGRLPSYIVKEALGKNKSYTLKVDQGHEQLDNEKLDEFISSGVFYGKFVLFVDSTVDSGRQIRVLSQYFEDPSYNIGHKAWGVIGSNDDNRDLFRHKNIDFGFDPDSTFEDRPELMGVDYAEDSLVKVVEKKTKISQGIKKALLDVPKGVVLDFSLIEDIIKAGRNYARAYKVTEKILASSDWYNSLDSPLDEMSQSCVSDTIVNTAGEKKKLLIVSSKNTPLLLKTEIDYLVRSLGDAFHIVSGSYSGDRGLLMRQFSKKTNASLSLYLPSGRSIPERDVRRNIDIKYFGKDKADYLEILMHGIDAVLLLGGQDGALKEVLMALYSSKPVFSITNFGKAGYYLSNSKVLRNHTFLHMADNFPNLVRMLEDYINNPN